MLDQWDILIAFAGLMSPAWVFAIAVLICNR